MLLLKFGKFPWETPLLESLSNEVAGLKVFSHEIFEIFKNISFEEQPVVDCFWATNPMNVSLTKR